MGYQVKLSSFEGPLDLLLHLIQKAEVDIQDIFVSEITSQYLELMNQLDQADMEKASEFLAMAATLVYIKSRSLLPRPAPIAPEEDPEKVLIRQLREYKAFKEASCHMLELREKARGVVGKLPEEYPLPPAEIKLEGLGVDELYRAFMGILGRMPEQPSPEREVHKDQYPIAERINAVRMILLRQGRTTLLELVGNGSRMKIIATFLAVLELIALGEVKVSQRGPFQEVEIERR